MGRVVHRENTWLGVGERMMSQRGSTCRKRWQLGVSGGSVVEQGKDGLLARWSARGVVAERWACPLFGAHLQGPLFGAALWGSSLGGPHLRGRSLGGLTCEGRGRAAAARGGGAPAQRKGGGAGAPTAEPPSLPPPSPSPPAPATRPGGAGEASSFEAAPEAAPRSVGSVPSVAHQTTRQPPRATRASFVKIGGSGKED